MLIVAVAKVLTIEAAIGSITFSSLLAACSAVFAALGGATFAVEGVATGVDCSGFVVALFRLSCCRCLSGVAEIALLAVDILSATSDIRVGVALGDKVGDTVDLPSKLCFRAATIPVGVLGTEPFGTLNATGSASHSLCSKA